MKPKAQRIAIAEAGGWTEVKIRQDHNGHEILCGLVPDAEMMDSQGADVIFCSVPDYLNDLNAMHEAEKVLDENQDHPIIYWEALEIIVGCKDSDNGNEMRKVICATATQRAEAFLKTLGLWPTN